MSPKLSLPNQISLEKRFSFIKDETHRTNTVIAFRYILFLISLEEEKLPGPILYSVYKDMIVQTGTVVESCIHYTLRTLFDKEIIKSSDVMEEEWKEEKCIIIEKVDDEKQICGIIRHKSTKKLERNTNFIELNRACLRANIFTEAEYRRAEEIRIARNKIHLAGLDRIDDIYKKEDVNKYFEYARIVLNSLENKLIKIP